MQNTFRRREKKVLIDESIFPEIEKRLSEMFIMDKHNICGDPYEICNIYFDNENRDVTRHSVSKPFFKEKLRLRSYGTPSLTDNVFFEIKRKTAKLGTKRRAILPLSEVYEFLESGNIPDTESYINRQVLSEIKSFTDSYSVRPEVYISYKRVAFYGKDDPTLRLTFDRDILTRHTDLRLEYGSYGDTLLPHGKMLMELKFSEAVPLPFARLMSEFGLSFQPYSKVGKEFTKQLIQKNNDTEALNEHTALLG